MHFHKKQLLILLLPLFAISCFSRWNAEKCAQTDFKQLGYSEGSQGKGNSVQSYNQACLKKDVIQRLTCFTSFPWFPWFPRFPPPCFRCRSFHSNINIQDLICRMEGIRI